jgi:hypothetical protein
LRIKKYSDKLEELNDESGRTPPPIEIYKPVELRPDDTIEEPYRPRTPPEVREELYKPRAPVEEIKQRPTAEK